MHTKGSVGTSEVTIPNAPVTYVTLIYGQILAARKQFIVNCLGVWKGSGLRTHHQSLWEDCATKSHSISYAVHLGERRYRAGRILIANAEAQGRNSPTVYCYYIGGARSKE